MEQPEGGRRGGHPTPGSRRPSWPMVVSVVSGVVFGMPALALAAVTTFNYEQASISVGDPLIEAYDYQQGTNQSWADIPAFDLGTYTDTFTDLEDPIGTRLDTVTLEPIGPTGVVQPKVDDIAWWDTSWNVRQCLELDHTTANASTVTEYQYRVPLDIDQLIADGYLQADTGDFRALASDGATQLPLWVDPLRDAVWVQVDSIAAGATTHFCLYFDHEIGGQAQLAIHTEAAVFTHSTPKPVYYAVHDRYGAGAPVDVVSYVDNNTIVQDIGGTTTTATLNNGELLRFAGNQPSTFFSTTGPVSSRNPGAGFETLVPISWASTRFVVPSERSRQRLSIYAPFADATVEIFEGANVPALTTVVVPQGVALWVEPPGDPVNNESILVTSDVPVLLMHDRTDSGNDAYPVAPYLSDEWYGVSSRARLGGDTNGTTVQERRSNTSVVVNRAVNRGSYMTLPGATNGGNFASGVRLTLDPTANPAGSQFAAITQADGDGNESATFFPEQELNSRYIVPSSSQYITFACPNPGFTIDITPPGGPTTTVTCTALAGSTVGWAKDTQNLAVIPSTTGPVVPGAGINVASTNGEPFYAYYENLASADETNVVGMKQGRQYTWPEPTVTTRLEGLFPATGTWLSPTILTPAGTKVFGQIDFDGVFEAGSTELRVRVATGPALPPTTFVGPDGTIGSFYTLADLPSALDFAHDGDDYARIEVELVAIDRTKTPQLAAIGFDYNLPLIVRSLGVPTTIAAPTVGTPELETVYLIRLKTIRVDMVGSLVDLLDAGSTASVIDRTLRLENLAAGIATTQSTTGPGPTDPPQPFGPGQPLSVLGDFALSAAPGTGTVDVRVHVDKAGGGIIAETDLSISLTAP